MPRIRNWKDLHLYRPGLDSRYAHIDELFSDQINWDLIESNRSPPDLNFGIGPASRSSGVRIRLLPT